MTRRELEIIKRKEKEFIGLDIEKSKEYLENDLVIVYDDKKVEDFGLI